MRHATDPDHVIAVSTIVSREREIGKSAWIGVFWGIGHTLTIFAVGAAIILFDVAISPRLGLSMELAVGLMLILLGIINVVSFFRDMPSAIERAGAPERATFFARAQAALDALEQQRFAEAAGLAGVLLPEYPNDGPLQLTLSRAAGHLIHPLKAGETFDPVWQPPGK